MIDESAESEESRSQWSELLGRSSGRKPKQFWVACPSCKRGHVSIAHLFSISLDRPWRQIDPIAQPQPVFRPAPLTRRRPSPIGCRLNQARFSWIVVEIIDLSMHGLWRLNVSIISTSASPKSARAFAIRLPVFHTRQKCWGMGFQPFDSFPCDGLLDV